MNDVARHRPVFLREVLSLLEPRPGGLYVDGTVGDGGHAEAILAASSPSGRVVAIDRDAQALKRAGESLSHYNERVQLVHGSYRELPSILATRKIPRVDGILLDLGASTLQLTAGGRGFSFRSEGPLDMRMDASQGPSAAELIEDLDQTELANLIYEFGEERMSRRIARAIKNALREGPLETTVELADVVRRAFPPGARHGRVHPATRTFQALRIAVNAELDHLQRFLDVFAELLGPGGTAVVLTYHSLEDRMVKRAFRALAKEGVVDDLTKRPQKPQQEEVSENPRARSAKLRAVRRAA